MAFRAQLLHPLLLSALLLGGAAATGPTHHIAVYWGQNSGEGSLQEACDSGLYKTVLIAFVHVFGNRQTPQMNLAGHCNPNNGGCAFLGTQINHCQDKNIKVLLSLGGGSGSYILTSAEEAKGFAEYLWNNFLGGNAPSRPLGATVLDGIDFDIEGGSPQHYDVLAHALKNYSTNARPVYLSAAPQCPYPDAWLDVALKTQLFDYLFVQFYNNWCNYDSAHVDRFEQAWIQWTTNNPKSLVFLGLPAAMDAAGSGYLDPDKVISAVLPKVQRSENYGGVMLWSRYWDTRSGFSQRLLPYAANCYIMQPKWASK